MKHIIVPGDLVCQNLSQPRPLFAGWRFQSVASARLVAMIARGSSIIVLSKTVVNPFDERNRLRKVLTPVGVGYMWEHELEMEPHDEVSFWRD